MSEFSVITPNICIFDLFDVLFFNTEDINDDTVRNRRCNQGWIWRRFDQRSGAARESRKARSIELGGRKSASDQGNGIETGTGISFGWGSPDA
jgi:hypothetical protein